MTGQLSVSSAHKGIFNSAVSLAWSGLPSGVTAALSKTSFLAPGDGTTVTTFTAAAGVTPGSYTATLTATGGGLTETVPVSLTVVPPPYCTLGSSVSPLAINAGQSASAQLACSGVQGTFAAPLTLAISGAPTGVTAKIAATTIMAGGSVALTLSTVQTMAAANFNLSLKATSGSFTSTLSIPVVVSANSFTLTAAQSAVTIKAAASGSATVTTAHVGAFNSAINLAWTLPSGVTVAESKLVAAPGDGSVVTTFTVSSTAKAGTYSATLSATGGGVTQTVPISLTIAAK
jgi:PKD repeat protein